MANHRLQPILSVTIVSLLFLVAIACANKAYGEQHNRFLRIGTGGTAGTYFPIGSIIATSISNSAKNGSLSSTAFKDLIAIAQRSNGSVANISDLDANLLEAGFAQADIAYWAYEGIGPFADEQPVTSIKVLGTLYLENVHLVVRKNSNIGSVSDLKGQRVSLDEVGSGTLLDVIPILSAFNLTTDDLKIAYLKTADSIDRMRNNKLDAFFVIAGHPVSAVSELVTQGIATVVPIQGASINTLTSQYPFFTLDSIPANTYNNNKAIPTLSVAALLLVHEDVEDNLVYELTQLLWNESTRKMLTRGHPKGAEITIDSALVGVQLPLHPGAEKFYSEKGMMGMHSE